MRHVLCCLGVVLLILAVQAQDPPRPRLDCGGLPGGWDNVALCNRLASMMAIIQQQIEQGFARVNATNSTSLPLISSAHPMVIAPSWGWWLLSVCGAWILVSINNLA